MKSKMELFISELHFIRPAWFYAFVPLVLISLILVKSNKQGKSWANIIDPKLLPHLLVGQSIKKSSSKTLLFFLVGALAIISLAGPAWEKRPQPVFKDKSALVIALDLSSSMDAADIKPSRLTRARHKITDILKQRKLGQTALLVYAGSAFVVTPLTDDTVTITSLLESLTTDIMPSQGTRTDKALSLAASLLKNADVHQGDILLVTDSIEEKAKPSFIEIAKQHRISLLAVATPQGAPIPLTSGGFLKDRRGNIIVPKLNIANFRDFNNIGNGNFSTLTADDTDIKTLSTLFNQSHLQNNINSTKTKLITDSWYEQGPWLLLLILPFAALAFRRGAIFVFVFFIFQQPQYVEASSLWDSLWQTADQQASKKFQSNEPAEAAKLFNNKQWKAASLYKNNQYQESIDILKDIETADAHYNAGNAYAKLAQTDKAIEEYNKSLTLNPKHQDALHNKKVLENQLKKEQKNDPQSKNDKNKDKKDGDKNQSEADESDKPENTENNNKQGKQDTKDNQSNTNDSKKSQSQDKAEEKDSEQNKEQLSKDDKNTKEKESDQTVQNSEEKESNKYNQEKDSEKNTQQQIEKMKEQQATKQWLRRIPDDPGGLLRNKFNYQYKRQQGQQSETDNW